ncbi:hypothetical protein GJ25_gp084 [Mycobacterium phage Hawkeye]|uniref:Uncharacterized protein n=1 Tax=Mycobacterium phage Hawkeye TaxID=1458711 RepID=X2KT54_9CAUD|nr:hypothetical protein GJ25_gp084 [Mycobacterium phage Hawkeye]AHN84095.1 hypothetical protein PBI_HAWKEYE_84 [Mycobacterium phage Hawkeye]
MSAMQKAAEEYYRKAQEAAERMAENYHNFGASAHWAQRAMAYAAMAEASLAMKDVVREYGEPVRLSEMEVDWRNQNLEL